jgi:acetyltransferase-like isoleucine patch superfamily enzyme
MILKSIETFLFRFGGNNLRTQLARRWGVKVGNNCQIMNGNFGSEPYLIYIGNHCEITDGVNFITHDGGTWVFRENRKFLGSKFGPIIIKDNCFIGINTIILPNVTIGPNSIVGAGSVVTNDVPENSVYGGNPARFISTLDNYLNKCIDNSGDLGTDDHRSINQKEKILQKFQPRFPPDE